MEPRIQYTKTSDGLNIAYWTLGEGMPLVHLSVAFSHAQLEWQTPECRRWYERLADGRKLVRFDYRGFGSSERNVTDFSVDAVVRDLEAVIDRLDQEKIVLLGPQHFAPVAIAYAARHPARVSQLILWCAWARGADWLRSPQVQAFRASLNMDWVFYTEAAAQVVLGWSAGDPARRYAALARDSVDPETHRGLIIPSLNEWDVTPMLAQVTSPTLVLHRRQYVVDVNVARGLASEIPDARLVLLEGESGAPYLGDAESVLNAIMEFLGAPVAPARGISELPSGMTAILFADVADSTALTERLGDAAFRAKARDLDPALRDVIREHAGTPIEGKLLGDGVLAVFTSARQAIEAALACARSGDDAGLPLHLGLHAGDVIREDNNVYGGAVNIASRIAGLSAAGEVLVSETVRSLARTSAGVRFEDRGEQSLKGVGEPVRVWAVREGAE
jgi:class 3 adenylate cyclase